MPDSDIPRVYTFPLADILLGVVPDNVAVPPTKDYTKSLTSKDPLPFELL